MLIWSEMTREEVGSAAPSAVALLPLGATEQHGPHLPTGTDHILAEAVCRLAAERAAHETVLLPVLPFGASGYHKQFGGTISLKQSTLRRVLDDVVDSLAEAGFKAIILLNGHSGNSSTIATVVQRESERSRMVVAGLSYWATEQSLRAAEGSFFGHAGAHETALLKAVRPDLFRPTDVVPAPGDFDLPPPGVIWAVPQEWTRTDGFFRDAPAYASLDGQALLDAAVEGLLYAVQRVAAASASTEAER